jgi:hypothetical protein
MAWPNQRHDCYLNITIRAGEIHYYIIFNLFMDLGSLPVVLSAFSFCDTLYLGIWMFFCKKVKSIHGKDEKYIT